MRTKLIKIATAMLILIVGMGNITAEARVTYVSVNGSGSKSGASLGDAKDFSDLLTFLSTANNFSAGHADTFYFAPGIYSITGNGLEIRGTSTALRGTFVFDKAPNTNGEVVFQGNNTRCFFTSPNASGVSANRYNMVFRNLIIRDFNKGTNATNGLFDATHNYVTYTLDSLIIDNCNPRTDNNLNASLLSSLAGNSTFNITHCTIRNCNFYTLLNIPGSTTNKVNFAYNSVYHNTFRNYLLTASGTTPYNIYNNTFSGNTLSGTTDATKTIQLTGGNYSRVFANNTMYNSGGLNFADNQSLYKILNNIVINEDGSGSKDVLFGTCTNVDIHNNIFSTASNKANYYTTQSGFEITDNEFFAAFDRSLINTQGADTLKPGQQVHPLNRTCIDYDDWDIHSGIDVTPYINYSDDQLGSQRPVPFALGATDNDYFQLRKMPPVYYIYTTPYTILPDKEVDLSQAISHRKATGAITYSPLPGSGMTITSTQGSTLTLSPNSHFATFTPQINPNSSTATFRFNLTQDGETCTATLDVRLFDATNHGAKANDLPGYVDPSGATCYDFMGKMLFSSALRFRTDTLRTGKNRIAWSSNTLVANLDRKGTPEIIALCIGGDNDSGASGDGGWTGVVIYDSKGNRLARLPFKHKISGRDMSFTHSGWHSATPFSLIDADRDGFIELIIAFPNGGTNYNSGGLDYRNRLVSYRLIPSGNTYIMEENWATNPVYNTGNTSLHKPVPQICDFNGDGVPEVLVYNKIYNAKTGDLILEMESMGSSMTNATAYMGLNRNAPNGGSSNQDRQIAFSCIYDITGDGIYDVIAGGKIYEMKSDANNKIYLNQTIEMQGVEDGYTAVADIDGDGKPEIVVVNTKTETNNPLQITVWRYDPLTNSKNVIAKSKINVVQRRFGSNSYVFIGDIDGRVQKVNGKEYRLPEIAILTGRISLSDASFPKHPNIKKIGTAEGGIPTTGETSGNNNNGCLFALTYDLAETDPDPEKKLKASFVLEHADDSNDTGFTMFDFDNDGINEICYRDNSYLRIIKPAIPFVKENEGRSDVILFKIDCHSSTGFEYPVIADIDGDNSAEIIVPGTTSTSMTSYHSYVYVAGNGTGDKFAPAWPVWNQYMYDPFKIKIDGDSLVTRLGDAPNRLDPLYNLIREIKEEDGRVSSIRDDYNPYNGNLIQATYIAGSLIPKYEPIVFLSDAYIKQGDDPCPGSRPSIVKINTKNYIEIVIGNRPHVKSSIIASWPIVVYNGGIGSDSTHYRLSDVLDKNGNPLGSSFTLPYRDGSNIIDTAVIRIEITPQMVANNKDSIFVVRLSDNSDDTEWHFGYNNIGGMGAADAYKGEFMEGLGVSSRQYRDCDWKDNVVRVAKPQTFPDYYTVQEYGSVTMPILANDILPDISIGNDPPFLSNLILDPTHIVKQPKAGYLTFNGLAGVDNRITYHHVDSLPLSHSIDSFQYRLKYRNPSTSAWDEKTETAYIYILQGENSGFTVCGNIPNTITLAELPEKITFDWYNNASRFLETSLSRTQAGAQDADSIYYIKPIISNVTGLTGKLQNANFPIGTLRITFRPNSAIDLMRWTGAVSSNWRDPKNWEAIITDPGGKALHTAYVDYIPSPCTDVIIPTSVENYPELTSKVACRDITIKDRAQLKNPHALTYNNARIEIKIKPEERDRFLMWSPPLMDMYTGDYHFRLNGTNPIWGDVFMNFFNQANPQYPASGVEINILTATTRKVDHRLVIGDAFNLNVKGTTVTGSDTLIFPRTQSVYMDNDYNRFPLTRTSYSSRFITDTVKLTNGMFTLPVKGGDAGRKLVLVTNPYLAYLKVSDFIDGNKNGQGNNIFQSGYFVWGGKDDAFIGTYNGNGQGYRYAVDNSWVTGTILSSSPEYILPLQSFFVVKSDPTKPVTHVKMSPAWTKTIPPKGSTYSLRSSRPAPNMLSIRLSSGDHDSRSAYAAIIYNPTSMPDRIDMPVVTYSDMALSVYTFSNRGEALIINGADRFGLIAHRMKLGMRVRDAGVLKLSFAGMHTFGYNAILIDKERNNARIDLGINPEYTFTVNKSPSGYAEINKRFELEFITSPAGGTLSESSPSDPSIRVSGKNGRMNVHALNGNLTSLQVYDALGKLVYKSASMNEHHIQIPLPARKFYLIRAVVSGKIIIEKVVL
jgi:hypothetical protein